MKLNYHLYSPNARCEFCIHYNSLQKGDGTKKIDYCGIISTDVEADYFCDFYVIRKLKEEEKKKMKIKKL
jgi:hypothetical protein